MRYPFAILPLLATLTPFTLADVQFTSPAAGGSLPAGALTVQWKNGDGSPALSTLETYVLEIVLGADDGSNLMALPLVSNGDFSTGNTATGQLPVTWAASTKNGFYFRMTSTGSTGATIMNYSDRFTVTGLTGTTPANIAKAVTGGTKGPTNPDNAAPAAGQADPAAGVVPAAGDYGVAFNLQGGPTKYAPMQPFPPTKITKKGKPTPQFPTSAFDIALTRMPPPTVMTTITESQTFHAMTMENTVAPQSHPKGDAAKFLARWKD